MLLRRASEAAGRPRVSMSRVNKQKRGRCPERPTACETRPRRRELVKSWHGTSRTRHRCAPCRRPSSSAFWRNATGDAHVWIGLHSRPPAWTCASPHILATASRASPNEYSGAERRRWPATPERRATCVCVTEHQPRGGIRVRILWRGMLGLACQGLADSCRSSCCTGLLGRPEKSLKQLQRWQSHMCPNTR